VLAGGQLKAEAFEMLEIFQVRKKFKAHEEEHW